jgi:sulfoxide reductase heme-binding subunit YedZ
MSSPRFRRRLWRHHVPLAIGSAAGLLVVYALVAAERPVARWSMATAYVGLVLLGVSLATGPLNVLRGRANPVSTDLRRDVGIWAGGLSIAHFAIGLQVHMKHRWLYWLRELRGSGTLVPRADAFGLANYTGLAAAMLAVLLLALSNDRSLRRLGTGRWKGLQRWNYALYGMVLVHGVIYQLLEKRVLRFVLLFAASSLPVVAVQVAGWRARRAGARIGARTGGRRAERGRAEG